MNWLLRPTLIGAVAVLVLAQTINDPFFRFDDYPVKERFSGTPATPKLIWAGDWAFRTMIRQGASKGPNFAGRYTIAEWGCGSACVSMAVIDAEDGTVFDAPFGILGWGFPGLRYEGEHVPMNKAQFHPLLYKLDSRLLVVRGCPEDQNCSSYYYAWTPPKFRLIRKVAAIAIRN